MSNIKKICDHEELTSPVRYFGVPLYAHVIRKVTVHALKMLDKAVVEAKQIGPLAPCSGVMQRCYGLPCKHVIDNCLRTGTQQ